MRTWVYKNRFAHDNDRIGKFRMCMDILDDECCEFDEEFRDYTDENAYVSDFMESVQSYGYEHAVAMLWSDFKDAFIRGNEDLILSSYAEPCETEETTPFRADEDAFMQLLKRAMNRHWDLMMDEYRTWWEMDHSGDIPGDVDEEAEAWKQFVDEWSYENRAELMDILHDELDLDRLERSWDLLDENRHDNKGLFRLWVAENIGEHGIMYQPVTDDGIWSLWYEFVTDYGTRHADEIIEKYGKVRE